MRKTHRLPVVFACTLLIAGLLAPSFTFAQAVRPIAFPVGGQSSYWNDFGQPRGGGTRTHKGIDVIAPKMAQLLSVVDGYVNYLAIPEASWGYEISLQDAEGYTYSYLHVNNDTPGTDDGAGGITNAYAPGVSYGAKVYKGQHIGWVGDSGNAENTVPHLHFEMRDPNGNVMNPYESLRAASGASQSAQGTVNTGTPDDPVRESAAELRYVFTKNLSFGMESGDVKHLQRVLRSFGHFTFPSATGYYGAVTQESVRSYQKKKGISVTGAVDLETRRKLNDDLGTYDPNDYVPFYSPEVLRAIEITKLRDQIRILEERLRAIRGY